MASTMTKIVPEMELGTAVPNKDAPIEARGEWTGAQVYYSPGPWLLNPMPASYKTYRLMRKDPTIALARALTVAPVLASNWSVACDDDVDDEAVKFIEDALIPQRPTILERCLFGGLDFGWAPFEKVFVEKDGYLTLGKFKPLLQDITTVVVNMASGQFIGFRQATMHQENIVDLELPYALNVAFGVEGTNWYGLSELENIRSTWQEWNDANLGAARYDKRIAGSHFVVYYPQGVTPVNGVPTDNFVVAQSILKTLESSGSIVVPRTVATFVDELNNESLGWKIEVLEDRGGRQPTFIDRLKYLDALKCRGLIMPERGIIEGEFGTKAEAGVHQNLALTHLELKHQHIVRMVNWHCVNQLLRVNFSADLENKVYIEPAPLDDSSITYLRDIYKAILTNQSGFLEEFPNIDTDALKDKTGVPKSEEVTPYPGEQPPAGLDPKAILKIASQPPVKQVVPKPSSTGAL